MRTYCTAGPAKHAAHVIALHAQNNPISENSTYPHFTDEVTLPKSCQRIRVLHCSEDRMLPRCPALPGVGAAVTCLQSHQLLLLLWSNARCAQPWQRVAEPVRAQAGNRRRSLILLRRPIGEATERRAIRFRKAMKDHAGLRQQKGITIPRPECSRGGRD